MLTTVRNATRFLYGFFNIKQNSRHIEQIFSIPMHTSTVKEEAKDLPQAKKLKLEPEY